MNYNHQERSQWRSTTSYLLVMLGAIIGLGNIIQFPYLISQYGGLFIFFYIFFEVAVSIPLLFAELIIGRRGKQNPVGSIGVLTMESGANRHWRKVGWLCAIISFLTLSYYTVQAAFPLSYFFGSLNVISIYGSDEPVPVAVHGDLMTQFLPLEIFFLLFLFATILVIVRGINRGLEMISWISVPAFSLILIVLAIYTSVQGAFLSSIYKLFEIHPDQSVLTVMLAAMTYAFFKLNVGMGSMIVYGSYLPYSTSFRRTTLLIVIFDAIISILSYFIIYPLMLASQSSFIENLTNHNVIYLFSDIPHGFVVAALFFLAAVLAAWTSTIAMAETVAVTLIERFGITRLRAAIIVFIGAALVGSFAAATHTVWMHVMLTDQIHLQGITRAITSEILVPISAILIAIFAGWVVKREISSNELGFSRPIYRSWLFLIKYIAPLCIVLVLLMTLLSIYP